MLKRFRRIPVRAAGVLALAFYGATLIIHTLILTRILPVAWINGSRSPNIEAQLPLSIVNIVVTLLGATFVTFASGIVGSGQSRWFRVTAWVLTGYWLIGLLQQLLGTSFERVAIAPLLLLAVFSHLRIALEHRGSR